MRSDNRIDILQFLGVILEELGGNLVVLHDLIHDLALDVSQKECKIVCHQTNSIDERVRHLSFSADHPMKSVPRYLKNVRTIVGVCNDSNFINLCISN